MTLQLTLAPDSASVPAARRFVRDSLHALGADGAVEDAEVLVSELATNALVHARSAFTVEVSRDGAVVRLCVLDGSSRPPRTRTYGTDATTGRGMRLVASLSTAWGVAPQGGGKTVWVELPALGSPGEVPAWEELDVDALLARFGDDDGPTGPVARSSWTATRVAA